MSIFSEHVIVITGASEGIGRALALVLAPQQPKLVLAARNEQRLQETAAECQRAGAKTCVIPTDVTNEGACGNLVHRTIEHFGGLHVLINNAGMTMCRVFEDVTDMRFYEDLMRVNYLGSAYCTKYALPYLKQSKGRLVAISSLAGITGVPARTGYCASKHAMMGFFESLRIELSGSGVTVTIIAPDFVQSEIRTRAHGSDATPSNAQHPDTNGIITTNACASMIVQALAKRQRLLITSRRGRLGRWARLIAPGYIDRLAQRAIYPR